MSFYEINLDTTDFDANTIANMPELAELAEYSLPKEVREAISNTKERDLYPVSKNEIMVDQVIRAKEISFASGATLTLSTYSFPFYVLYADTFSFIAPFNTVEIRLPKVVASAGTHGKNGRQGMPGAGGCGRTGCQGGPGEPGTNGSDGGTIECPRIYIFVNKLKGQPINPNPGIRYLKIIASGVAGGRGGDGGRGGKGGEGADGAKASDGLASCKAGPGRGGDGGAGGSGGRPGNGGRGTDGSTICFCGPQNTLSLIASFSEIENQGAVGGEGGNSGAGGPGGEPGEPGKLSTFCRNGNSKGSRGNDGFTGEPKKGYKGKDGVKGDVIRIEVTDVSDLIL